MPINSIITATTELMKTKNELKLNKKQQQIITNLTKIKFNENESFKSSKILF